MIDLNPAVQLNPTSSENPPESTAPAQLPVKPPPPANQTEESSPDSSNADPLQSSPDPATSADPIPQNTPKLPIPKNNSPEIPQLNLPPSTSLLSVKQQTALNHLFAGADERFICQSLKIDRKTLYTWKTRHPAFMAEFHRRSHEVWNDVAGELRQGVSDAVSTLRFHLTKADDMTQLRAARALITLVNSPRLQPAEPTTIPGVLDHLLRASTPPASESPAFTDAQRQTLLDQLLAQNAAVEAQAQAELEARRQNITQRTKTNKQAPATDPVTQNP